ncbi:Transcription regulator, PadR [Alteracholeplasma palmae J233]|uniref:Transcription regulator, PadR n=1 Tax=Alteracholeplasma palmae (strain ATCC 49389 / J233) TaxID=1318466 RepID=U4KK66_ALTPJ|nr:PadR family transcriptional regulator [Alteracholeplasma palmae]CCV63917.1 Transcription regulator, PadR [Alteracholeplasma palmae J233]
MQDYKVEIEEKIKYGFIEIIILLLLKSEDMYGYQIVQEIEKRSNGTIIVKEGSLYGPLYRLEKKNYVSTKKELVGKKRFRNYYHMEADGLKYLEYALETFKSFSFGLESIFNWKEPKNEK